jgi:alanyl-tRNA synthetase
MQGEIKALQSENEKLKNQMAKDAVGNVMDQVVEINGVKLLAVALKDTGMNELRNLGDQFKEKLGNGVVVIASAADGKVNTIQMRRAAPKDRPQLSRHESGFGRPAERIQTESRLHLKKQQRFLRIS